MSTHNAHRNAIMTLNNRVKVAEQIRNSSSDPEVYFTDSRLQNGSPVFVHKFQESMLEARPACQQYYTTISLDYPNTSTPVIIYTSRTAQVTSLQQKQFGFTFTSQRTYNICNKKKVKFYWEKKRLIQGASGAVKRDQKTEISDETTEMLQALVSTRWFKYDRDWLCVN